MKWPQRLAALFNVYPDESRVVYVLLLHSFCAGVAEVLTATAGYSLFLSTYSTRMLPFLYFGVTVAAVTASLVMLNLQERVSFSSLMLGGIGLIALVLLGFRVALEFPAARAVAIALPIWYRVMYAFLNVEFWGVAGRLFNVRQGKRLFGLIASGETAGSALIGLTTPALVAAFGTANLLVAALLAVLCALVSLFYLTRTYAARLATPPEPAETLGVTPTDRWWRIRYIELIFALSALYVVAYLVVDNIFMDRAHAHFPDTARLASFLGLYEGILGCVTLIGTLFITSRFLTRFGVGAGLLAEPSVIMGSMLLVLVVSATVGSATLVFALVTLARILNVSATQAMSQPTIGLLYQPLPVALRLRVQTAASGIIPALGACFAAGVLLIFNTLLGFSAIQLIYVLLFFLAIWLAVAVLLNREYAPMLLQALSKRRLDSPTLALTDASSIPVLRQALTQPQPEAVIYALHTLAESGIEPVADVLPVLLAHPEARIRVEALQVIEQQRLVDVMPVLRERLEREDDGRVRGALLRTLAALDPDTGREQVLPFLADPDPETRLGALVGLLRSGGIEGVLLAGTQLLDLARSSSAEDRVLAARVVGGVGNSSFYKQLVPLLRDDAPAVRIAAVAAAGMLKAPQLWPLVVESMDVAEARGTAVAVLAAGGAAVVPELRAIFERTGQPRATLCSAARICGRMRRPEAIALLEEQLAHPDAVVREQVLTALSQSRYRAEGAALGRVWDQIGIEVAGATRAMAAMVALGADGEVALVSRALSYKFQQIRARLFLLLSFVFEPQAILRARATLLHGPRDRHANALEVLDIAIAHNLKPALLAVFEDLAPAERLRRLRAFLPPASPGRDALLLGLAAGGDDQASPWLRAAALHSLVSLSSPLARDTIIAARSASDPLVRGTAEWALDRLDGSTPSQPRAGGRTAMLSTIEKVLILTTVNIFAGTPDEILAEIAAQLEETVVPAEATIFEKGDIGDSLYIIVNGRVRVHDGPYTLNELGERSVFGEMAAVDPAPRSASVTALEETSLLRLDRDALYEVMADQIEVVRGIMHVLSEYVRVRAQDVADLSARVRTLEGTRESVEKDLLGVV